MQLRAVTLTGRIWRQIEHCKLTADERPEHHHYDITDFIHAMEMRLAAPLGYVNEPATAVRYPTLSILYQNQDQSYTKVSASTWDSREQLEAYIHKQGIKQIFIT